MRLGISSWTYPWAVGVRGFPSPAKPMRLATLLARAAALKVRVVQVADNLPLHEMDPAEFDDACAQALDLGLTIELGTRGIAPDHLLHCLGLAGRFKAVMVRTLLDSPAPKTSLEQAEVWIRKVLPEFEAQGVTLGLENYEAHSCRDLADLVRKLENQHVGVCLDTVNSLGALETLDHVVEALAPLTISLHVKDFVIERVPTMMGFAVRGASAGTGRLEIPAVLARMRRENNVSVILEQWPPFQTSIEATIKMEQEWAERGIEYLRSCGCT